MKPTDTTNLDIYGDAVLDWDRADRALANPLSDMQTWFLGTVDPDSRPHATGVGAFYLDGDLYFTSGPGTRKSRNLASNPAALTAPYSAPSAGPAPWHLYRLRFHTVYGVATAEPYGATRWRFS